MIKKIIPKQFKRKFRSKITITKPQISSPSISTSEVLSGQIAYNQYGGYMTPLSSIARPAVQKILQGKVYEPETIKFITDNCSTGDVIHAGTFFGDFLPGISSSLFKEAKLWAFEPNLENFRCAQITTIINNLENIELFNFGLGDIKSNARMLVELESGYKLGGASKILREKENGKTIEVEMVLLDDIIPEGRAISIIQLDVEGYELEALSGAIKTIKRCKPILILEDLNKIIETDWFARNILSIGYEINCRVHANTVLKIKSQHKTE